MKLSKKQITSFRQKIFLWWPPHRRDLPWRHTRDPYRIMVSEVMLQQTQVLRVIDKYNEFIEAFPTVKDLAQASPAQILRIWKGMGYNRRALYLRSSAQIICDQYNGQIPNNYELLTRLPGLGTYTARAIMVFAYGQEVPLVDTNIRQIITHFFFSNQAQGLALMGRKGRALEKDIEDIARQLIPPGKSWEWHQALMDYGAIAMTNIQIPITNKKKQKPFKDSNRYYRGRIVDRLREGEAQEKEFLEECASAYGKSKKFLVGILDGLIKEGLIERTRRGVLRLPGDK